jgi:hypothetical protein
MLPLPYTPSISGDNLITGAALLYLLFYQMFGSCGRQNGTEIKCRKTLVGVLNVSEHKQGLRVE